MSNELQAKSVESEWCFVFLLLFCFYAIVEHAGSLDTLQARILPEGRPPSLAPVLRAHDARKLCNTTVTIDIDL